MNRFPLHSDRLSKPRRSRLRNERGFTLLETLIAAFLLSILFLGVAPFFAARFSANKRIANDSLPPIIGRGIADAIHVGADEHYDPIHNILTFDYEGIRVEIDLPEPYETREYPGIVIRDSRNGILDTPVHPNDISTVTTGGYALAHGVVIRPGPDHVLDSETLIAGDDLIVAPGLYPLGPVLLVKPEGNIIRPGRAKAVETIGLPIDERDLDGDGIFEALENFNGSLTTDRGFADLAQDTYEDTGPDRLRSFDEPGYHPVLNPDPTGDDFDPVLNPNGPEGNGRLDRREDVNDDRYLNVPDLHLDEDINQDGLLNNDEIDLNGNELQSSRGVAIADRPPLANSQRPSPISLTPPKPSYPPPSDPVRSLGYAIIIQRPSDQEVYKIRILIYADFLNVRESLSRGTPLRRYIVSHGEVGQQARDNIDNDLDGVVDDTSPIRDRSTADPNDFTTAHPFATPERERNGIDDDGDGVVDDGLIEPIYIHTFVLRVGTSTVSMPGDPR